MNKRTIQKLATLTATVIAVFGIAPMAIGSAMASSAPLISNSGNNNAAGHVTSVQFFFGNQCPQGNCPDPPQPPNIP